MVVGFSPQDGLRPVELFDSEEADHLVTKGQGTQGQFFFCGGLDGGIKPVGTPYDQCKVADAPVVAVFDPARELDTSGLFAAFIEEHHMVDVIEGFQENRSFGGLQLIGGGLGGLQFGVGQLDIAEGGLASETTHVFVNPLSEPGCVGLANDNEGNAHARSSVELTCRPCPVMASFPDR